MLPAARGPSAHAAHIHPPSPLSCPPTHPPTPHPTPQCASPHVPPPHPPTPPTHPHTQDVDIFSKDFVFVPIHDALHWSLAVVCFPGVAMELDAQGNASAAAERTPCVLLLDSMKGGALRACGLGLCMPCCCSTLRMAGCRRTLLLLASVERRSTRSRPPGRRVGQRRRAAPRALRARCRLACPLCRQPQGSRVLQDNPAVPGGRVALQGTAQHSAPPLHKLCTTRCLPNPKPCPGLACNPPKPCKPTPPPPTPHPTPPHATHTVGVQALGDMDCLPRRERQQGRGAERAFGTPLPMAKLFPAISPRVSRAPQLGLPEPHDRGASARLCPSAAARLPRPACAGAAAGQPLRLRALRVLLRRVFCHGGTARQGSLGLEFEGWGFMVKLRSEYFAMAAMPGTTCTPGPRLPACGTLHMHTHAHAHTLTGTLCTLHAPRAKGSPPPPLAAFNCTQLGALQRYGEQHVTDLLEGDPEHCYPGEKESTAPALPEGAAEVRGAARDRPA
jgi:hypothetical protein